jgi:hypothetical protein
MKYVLIWLGVVVVVPAAVRATLVPGAATQTATAQIITNPPSSLADRDRRTARSFRMAQPFSLDLPRPRDKCRETPVLPDPKRPAYDQPSDTRVIKSDTRQLAVERTNYP